MILDHLIAGRMTGSGKMFGVVVICFNEMTKGGMTKG